MKYFTVAQLGHLAGLYLSQHPAGLESTAYPAIELDHTGPVGDKHASMVAKSDARQVQFYKRGTPIRNNRQWSAVSVEELATIQTQMAYPEVRPEWVGANLLVSGIPHFTQLPPMSLLVIRPDGPGKVVLVVHDENLPCVGPNKAIQAHYDFVPAQTFMKAGMGRRGLVGWVEKAGPVAVGDPVQVLLPRFVAPEILARWAVLP